MSKKIRKAVFPVAGMGTRFLPATKANPKEMLPVVDKPLIQYAVEEAIAAGVTELIFVTSSSKRAIEDHFDSNFELEYRLEQRGHDVLLHQVRNILPEGVSCAYIRQPHPAGLGHAVLCAKNLVGNEPFAVLLADDLIQANHTSGCLKSMVDIHQCYGSSVVAVESVPMTDVHQYGIVGLKNQLESCVSLIETLIEKPSPEKAPSNLAVVGRYILMPQIFDFLEKMPSNSGNEIQLTDAIFALLSQQSVYAYTLQGKRYDCGNKLGYLRATVEYALCHPDLAQDFANYLKHLMKSIN